MAFWEAEEPALILKLHAHHKSTEKNKMIGKLQNLSMNLKKSLEYE